jgi:hypothetical protein
MTIVISVLAGAIVGFILGALVYRNNKDKVEDVVDAVKK